MKLKKIITIMILCLAISLNVFGIGIIVPERIQPGVAWRPLTLIRQDVAVAIKNDVSRTHITQVFYNPYPQQLEATYIFPLPPEAQITDFVMYINGKPVRGEILEKGQARAIYEDIVRRMRDPGLLEFYDWQLFKMRIFPVPPQGKQKIEVEYVQVLKVDNNVVHFSFPISERDFAEVNIQDLKEWSFNVTINADKPIKTIYSPTHELDVETSQEQKSAKIKISPEDLQAVGKDVAIYYTYSASEYGLNILPFRPEADEKGFFLLIISPGRAKAGEGIIPKDIIFVIDTSGSMSGEKIAQAKQALNYCVQSLAKTDRFNIVSFSTEVQQLAERLLPATAENIKQARKFTEELQARGGTNINEALLTALKLFANEEGKETKKAETRLKEILFLTDGLPTVGITNPQQILENVEKQNCENLRIFCFGVGYDVNTRLLDGIAQKTRALATYIRPEEDIEVKVSSLYDKISQPAMTDLKVDFGEIKVEEIYPKEMPDLFSGADVTVIGKYNNSGHTAITLSGKVGEEVKKIVYECTFPERETGNEFIEKLWGSRKIGYLLDAIRQMGEDKAEAKELIDEVIQLSKKYGIVTPYTSYLVQEDREPVTSLPRPLPGEIHFKERFRVGAREAPAPAMRAESGRQAVEQSLKIARIKESVRLEEAETKQKLVSIKGKTFMNQKGVWVDIDLKEKEAKVLRIKYLSPAYFELLKLRPDLTEFLQLGEKLKMQLADKIILEISNEGEESLTDAQRILLKKK